MDTSKNSDLPLLVKFPYRVVIAPHLAVSGSQCLALEKFNSKIIKALLRRVTAGAKEVFRGAHILEQKKRQVTSFVLLT